MRNESVLMGVATLRQDELTRAARAAHPKADLRSNPRRLRLVWKGAARLRAAVGAAAYLIPADSAGSCPTTTSAQEILR